MVFRRRVKRHFVTIIFHRIDMNHYWAQPRSQGFSDKGFTSSPAEKLWEETRSLFSSAFYFILMQNNVLVWFVVISCRLFGPTGVCSQCMKIIPPLEMVMRAREHIYHLDCFACQVCHYRFCVGDKFFLHFNIVLCEADYYEVTSFFNQLPCYAWGDG